MVIAMQTNKFLGSILLIAGTSIGAGMLALPVSTAAYGFAPSIFMFVLCWLCMMATGLLLLEVNLWLKPGANIVSMATQTLGVAGKVIAWITYLLLFYSLMAAYVSGMGDLVHTAFNQHFQLQISTGTGSLLLILLVGSAVYLGMRSVDYLNRFFFFGKLITYVAVVAAVSPFVEMVHLTPINFNHAWLALPIIITSFGFQNTIPGLRVYLNDDIRKIRLAILIGSSIPLFIYIIWEFVIIGVVPLEGKQGLLQVLAAGQPATGLATALDHIVQNGWISNLFKTFTLCAIVTSFIGVSFGLFDFLIDSFSIKRNQPGRVLAIGLTFFPPLIFAFVYPDGFILALGYAGIFVAILLGILPALMSWSGRHWTKIATGYRPCINRFGLVVIILFSLVIIYSQLKA
jgi:tyrosine-specific transport protein